MPYSAGLPEIDFGGAKGVPYHTELCGAIVVFGYSRIGVFAFWGIRILKCADIQVSLYSCIVYSDIGVLGVMSIGRYSGIQYSSLCPVQPLM